MKSVSWEDAVKLLTSMPRKGRRIPQNQDDWGDDKTIGLQLKKRDFDFNNSDPSDSFGMYLGSYDNKYVVVRYGLLYEVLDAVVYDSQEEMKKDWVLD